MSSSSAPEKTFSSLVSHQYNIWPCSPTATAATYYSSKSFEAFASNDQKSRDEFPQTSKNWVLLARPFLWWDLRRNNLPFSQVDLWRHKKQDRNGLTLSISETQVLQVIGPGFEPSREQQIFFCVCKIMSQTLFQYLSS